MHDRLNHGQTLPGSKSIAEAIGIPPFNEQARVIHASGLFDGAWYAAQNSDVGGSGLDPLIHYVEFGWSEGRDPSPTFSTVAYLKSHPDAAGVTGLCPLYHFAINRSADRPVGVSISVEPIATPVREIENRHAQIDVSVSDLKQVIAAEFDTDFYLASYRDVAEAGVNPLDHYIYTGWREGRDPCANFSTSFYIDANPDVVTAGVHPFYHYLVAGRPEGRKSVHPGGWRANHLLKLKSVEDQIDERVASRPTVGPLLSPSDILRKLKGVVRRDKSHLIVSISHDNYRASVGGVQFCIKAEEELAQTRGGIYLNLHPARPLPFLARERDADSLALAVVCDGRLWGIASAASIITALSNISATLTGSDLIVHSLLGHSPEVIVDLQKVLDGGRAVFWIHDFSSICPPHTLLRNGVSFCGAPSEQSSACFVCVYGEERKSHLRRLESLFEQVQFKIVAPSAFAADFWRSHSNLPAETVLVQPHCTLESATPAIANIDLSDDPAVRVAFMGHPVAHKGWETFIRIVDASATGFRYEFHHFGSDAKRHRKTLFTAASVIDAGPTAMLDALRRQKIDIAVLWSIWPETFSFVAYEALAAGAFIVTCEESGNIARLVRSENCGVVFKNDAAVMDAFDNGTIYNIARQRRARPRNYKSLKFGDFSIGLLALGEEQ